MAQRTNKIFNDPNRAAKTESSVLKILGLAILIAVTFRIFLSTVLYSIEFVMEIILQVSVILYIIYRLVNRIVRDNFRFLDIEIYLGILLIFPIAPAIAAYYEFGQPVYYGVATYRDYYLLFGGLIIFNLLREKIVSITEVEKAFVGLAVVFMAFSYLLTIFVDPAQFKETGIAGTNPEKGEEIYYRVNMAMFFFGAIYFSVKYFYQKNLLHLLIAGLFIFYVVFIRLDRTSMVVLAVGLLMFLTTATSIRTQFLTYARAVLPLGILLLGVYLLMPELFYKYQNMFLDVFETASKADTGAVERNVRLLEVKVAYEGFMDNHIFGHGKVSNYFVPGGYNHFYGFFYTSDVGILGYLFSSGIFGIIIIFSQYIFAIKSVRGIKRVKRNVFLVSIKFTLLVLALDAITTEYLTLYAGQTMTLILLLYYFYLQDKVVDTKMRVEATREVEQPIPALVR
jgi:hypothetical protein